MQNVDSTVNPAAVTTDIESEYDKTTRKRLYLSAAVVLWAFLAVGVARAQQYPLLDEAANKVVQKYQNSSCQQLWQDRQQPKSEREQRVVNFLRSDPQMRQMFIDRVAAPVANKLFECGMIP